MTDRQAKDVDLECSKLMSNRREFVWGVPSTVLPVVGLPPHTKARLRLRNKSTGMIFIKDANGVRMFPLVRSGSTWRPALDCEQGRNVGLKTVL